jgi:hypothetical protein
VIQYCCDSLGVGAHVEANHDLGGETTRQDLVGRLCGRAEGGPATQQAILLPPASLRCYRPTRGSAISMLVTSRFALPPASCAQSSLRPVSAFPNSSRRCALAWPPPRSLCMEGEKGRTCLCQGRCDVGFGSGEKVMAH